MAVDFFEDFKREHPDTKGADLFETYIKRISFIPRDVITHPFLPDEARIGARKEWESDPFATSAIAEKIALLSPEVRETIELVIDGCLKGETIEFFSNE